MMATLKEEKEIKEILVNTVNELSVTHEDIKKAANTDAYISKMKKQVWWYENKKKKEAGCLLFQYVMVH